MSARPDSSHSQGGPANPQNTRHSEERKSVRVPPPIVEAHLITQHGQGGHEVEEAPAYNENLISFEPVFREEDVASIEVVDLQRTPHRYHSTTQQRQSRQPADQMSIYSDSGSVWEDVRALQGELRRKRKELDEVRRRCVIAETEIQNGEIHSERIKVKVLEEELEKVRGDLRKRERELHGLSNESEAAEKQHLKSMLGHKEHENQLLAKEVAGLKSEKQKLKEHINSIWSDYQKYKTQHEGILKSLEKERLTLVEKLSKRDGDVGKTEILERESRITLLRAEVDDLNSKMREKDERMEQLHRTIDSLQRENKTILESYQPAEPPPEEAQPEETRTVSPQEPVATDTHLKPEVRPRPITEEQEQGPEVTTVSEPLVEEFEEISLEETHPSATKVTEETKEPVRHGEEAAGTEVHKPIIKPGIATNPFSKPSPPEVSQPQVSNPFVVPQRAPENTIVKSKEVQVLAIEEPEVPQVTDAFDFFNTVEDSKQNTKEKATPTLSKVPQKTNPFLSDSTAEDDFFAEMQKKGSQDKKKPKPFTSIPKTLFD